MCLQTQYLSGETVDTCVLLRLPPDFRLFDHSLGTALGDVPSLGGQLTSQYLPLSRLS